MSRVRPKKVIIDFTPTGMIPTKRITPYVPISPNEIIKEASLSAPLTDFAYFV